MVKRKKYDYVAVRGYIKRMGRKRIRVKAHVRKIRI
jgi:hypothetical protein